MSASRYVIGDHGAVGLRVLATCGGGTRSRSRSLCCLPFQSLSSCLNSCNYKQSDTQMTGTCNNICYNGYWSSGRCRCYGGYKGSCCNDRICCGYPGSITNGRVTGTNYCYGGVVTYACNTHYNLTSGSYQRTCSGTSSGYWTGTSPRCVFVNTCASNPCQNGATCMDGFNQYTCRCAPGWIGTRCQTEICCGNPGSIPNGGVIGTNFCHGGVITYVCNAHYNLTSGSYQRTCTGTSTGYWTGSQPECVFVNTCGSNPCQNGGTCVDGLNQYTCHCGPGWSGTHCEIDVLPPDVHNCPTSTTYRRAHQPVNVTWQTPVFTDDHGTEVDVVSNFIGNSHSLKWGEYTVQYVATKRVNGLRAECIFDVTVYPLPCPNLPVLEHGVYACNGWNKRFTEVCTLFCPHDRDVPIGMRINELYVCGGTGAWIPPINHGGCSRSRRMMDAKNTPEEMLRHYYTPVDCKNTAASSQIRENYLNILSTSRFSEMCEKWETCVANEVNVICE